MIQIVDGYTLIECLLKIADEEGKIIVDKTTYLPDIKHYKNECILIEKLCSLMNVYGINPILDKDFIDERPENYFICFINNEFSDQRKELTLKHLNKMFRLGKSDLSAMMSTRKARFESFLYLFKYRKKLHDLEFSNCDFKELGDSHAKLVCKSLTDILFCKKIEPACAFLEKAMLLLMGDYVDKKYKDIDLIRDFGYPGIIPENINKEPNDDTPLF